MDPEQLPNEQENMAEASSPLEPILEHGLIQRDQQHQEAQQAREHGLMATADVADAVRALEPVLEASVQLLDTIRQNTEPVPPPEPIPATQVEDNHTMIIKGVKGDKGDKGDQGDSIVGPIGPQGEDGPQGIQGEKGEKGDKGDKGESIKGDKGDPGEKGEKGERGEPGKAGTKGKDGVAISGDDIVKKLMSLEGEKRLDLSALKGVPTFGRGGGGPGYLREIADVDVTGLANGQTLIWNSTLNKWRPGTGGGGSGTVTNVSSTTAEITITNPTTTPALTIVSAPKLTTPRNINGVAFDGTADITIADSTKVPTTRSISVVAPLSGGGDLSADRTITTSMATGKLIGRGSAGTGVMEEITIGSGLSLAGTTLSATGGGAYVPSFNRTFAFMGG